MASECSEHTGDTGGPNGPIRESHRARYRVKVKFHTNMDREELKKLSINELRAMAAQLKINSKSGRADILLGLLNYYDQHGWPNKEAVTDMAGGSITEVSGNTEAQGSMGAEIGNAVLNFAEPTASVARPIGSASRNLTAGINMQEIVQAVVQILSTKQHPSPISGATASYGSNVGELQASPYTANNIPPTNWHQVKCAGKLIPSFAGKEEENVVKWLDRISHIARMYQFNEDVTLLASIGQLKERALAWYNRQPLESVSNWDKFKFNLRRYYRTQGVLHCNIGTCERSNLEIVFGKIHRLCRSEIKSNAIFITVRKGEDRIVNRRNQGSCVEKASTERTDRQFAGVPRTCAENYRRQYSAKERRFKCAFRE